MDRLQSRRSCSSSRWGIVLPGRLRARVFGAALILALGPGAHAAAGEVRVGAVSDLTGAYSHVGAIMAEAKDLAASQVNAQGGLLASGETLTLVRGDGQCDADKALVAAQQLTAGEGVVAMVGATCSGATLAIARNVTIPAGMLQISPSSTAPSISQLEDGDAVFRVSPPDTLLGIQLAGMILDRGITRVAVTNANDDYNRGVNEVFIEAFERNGGIIVAAQEHVPGETDLAGLIDGLATEGVQSLVVFAYYDGSGADVILAAQEDGRFEIFFGADGMIHDGLIAQVGAENLSWALFMIAATNDRHRAFVAYAEAAREAGLDPSVPFTAHSYDSVFLTALAIEKAGSTDPAAIRAALRSVASEPGTTILPGEWAKAKDLIAAGEEINYLGASGEIEFDSAGDTEGLFSVNTVRSDATWDVFVLR